MASRKVCVHQEAPCQLICPLGPDQHLLYRHQSRRSTSTTELRLSERAAQPLSALSSSIRRDAVDWTRLSSPRRVPSTRDQAAARSRLRAQLQALLRLLPGLRHSPAALLVSFLGPMSAVPMSHGFDYLKVRRVAEQSVQGSADLLVQRRTRMLVAGRSPERDGPVRGES